MLKLPEKINYQKENYVSDLQTEKNRRISTKKNPPAEMLRLL
jgi:hypothetical protein